MGVCANCGNNYDQSFKIEMNGQKQEFDCFECAIQLLAPTCQHCDTRIIGHGVQAGDKIFCCAHCAREESVQLIDRADAEHTNWGRADERENQEQLVF